MSSRDEVDVEMIEAVCLVEKRREAGTKKKGNIPHFQSFSKLPKITLQFELL